MSITYLFGKKMTPCSFPKNFTLFYVFLLIWQNLCSFFPLLSCSLFFSHACFPYSISFFRYFVTKLQSEERKEKILGGPLLFAIFLVFLTNSFLNPLCIILLAARLCISFFSGILSANLKMHDWNTLFFKRGKEQTETETDILSEEEKGTGNGRAERICRDGQESGRPFQPGN